MHHPQQPQSRHTQQIRAHHGLVGRPYDGDAVISKPAPPLVESVPVDALYKELIQKFTPVEEPAKPAVAIPEPVLAPEDAKFLAYIRRNYSVDWFRKEINLGLKNARILLRAFAASWRDSNDLKQQVDIEIWKAFLHYKREMNGAIAYTIAKNQAGKFLGRQIKEQEIVVTTPLQDASGKPVGKKMIPALDEFGNEKRVPRYDSLDVKGKDEEGKACQSPVESKLVMDASPPIISPPLDKFTQDQDKHTRNLPALRALVDGWYGAKRIVGEVFLLDPGATVREFPGVSKSNAGRVLKVVKAEFRALLEEKVGQS